ncbi:MAG: CapA family protein [Chloroflexi bacterium]|nr:CapA family protein [Chloroflexota bacterium]
MSEPASQEISLVAVGDIHIQRDDAPSILAKIEKFTREADFAFANLEMTLTGRGTLQGSATHRGKPPVAVALKQAGFNAVSLANNHTMRFGTEGLADTIEIVERAGIAHAGGGANIAEAHKPAILERKGTRVALLSYSSVFPPNAAATRDSSGIAVVKVVTSYAPHPRVFEVPGSPATVVTIPDRGDVQAFAQDIKDARAQADIVVVALHWGMSGGYADYVPYQFEMGHFAVDSGADLVVGAHPHEALGIESYKGKAIFYSMGNFAMELEIQVPVHESIALRCQIGDRQIQRVSFLPVLMDSELTPEIVDTKNGARVVEWVTRQSARFGTTFTVEPEEVVVNV